MKTSHTLLGIFKSLNEGFQTHRPLYQSNQYLRRIHEHSIRASEKRQSTDPSKPTNSSERKQGVCFKNPNFPTFSSIAREPLKSEKRWVRRANGLQLPPTFTNTPCSQPIGEKRRMQNNSNHLLDCIVPVLPAIGTGW